MTALAPTSRACCSISANASPRAVSHSSVSSVMLPPISVCRPAPIEPITDRDRTVMPRTTPSDFVVRYPSSAFAVVVIATESSAIRCPLLRPELRRVDPRRRTVEHRVEDQLEGRTRLRPEVDLAAHRHHVALADTEGDDVRLIAEEILAEEPAALQDRAARGIAGDDFALDLEAGLQAVGLVPFEEDRPRLRHAEGDGVRRVELVLQQRPGAVEQRRRIDDALAQHGIERRRAREGVAQRARRGIRAAAASTAAALP